MDFKKFICPVCNNAFKDGDDVVVCPDCGTPHHRECWKITGKCFNENLHGTDTPVELVEAEIVDEIKEEAVEKNPEKMAENRDFSNKNEIPEFLRTTEVQSTLIEGKPTVLYEIAVGKNQKYYIPRFAILNKLKNGISWNFMAFLVPLSWSLYRKMYKFSAIFLALYLVIFGVTGYFIMNDEAFVNSFETCLQEDPEFYADVSMYLSGSGNVSLSPAEQEFIKATENIKIPTAANVALSAIPIILRVIMGLFANREYLKKLRKNIEAAEKKGLMGDELKGYLYRHYGTLPFILVAIIGFFEWRIF